MEKNVVVPITTDKGLCGGINSTVSKYARATLSMIGDDGTLGTWIALHRSFVQV